MTVMEHGCLTDYPKYNWPGIKRYTRFEEIAKIDEELFQFNVRWQNEKIGMSRLLWQVDLLSELHKLLHEGGQ